jgi:hypothetical protein
MLFISTLYIAKAVPEKLGICKVLQRRELCISEKYGLSFWQARMTGLGQFCADYLGSLDVSVVGVELGAFVQLQVGRLS